ncbi:MAG: hypothetical protein RIK87_22855 [Fuerstiella sp.]
MYHDQVIHEREIEDCRNSGTLPDKLDSAIGDASTGIGVLLSELVRRSLRGGVAHIDETLAQFAEDQVDVAVEKQMPHLTEAAETVAESTSRRVTDQKLESTVEQLHGDIRAAEERAVNQTEELGRRLEENLHKSRQQVGEAVGDLQSLREKARSNWKRVVREFETLNEQNTALKSELAALQSRLTKVNSELKTAQSELTKVNSGVKKVQSELKTVNSDLRPQIDQLTGHNEQLEKRLAELEKPRGLKAVWQRLKPGQRQNKLPDDSDDGGSEVTDIE